MPYTITDNKRAGTTGAPLIVRFINAKQQRRALAVQDRIEAGERIMAECNPETDWGDLPAGSWAKWMCKRLNTRALTPGYIEAFAARMAHFVKSFGETPLNKITTKHLRQFRRDIAAEYKAPTVMAICHSVGQLFREAVEVGGLAKAPSKEAFKTMSRYFDRRPILFPQQEEQELLLANAETLLERLSILIFLDAAARPDEARALEGGDVRDGCIHFTRVMHRNGSVSHPRNTARVREVVMTPRLAQVIEEIHAGADENIVIKAGGRRTHHAFEVVLDNLQRRIGMVGGKSWNGEHKPKFTALMLRHACIMGWYERNLDAYTILLAAGLSSITSLKSNYSKLFISDDDIEAIDSVAPDSPPSVPPGTDDDLNPASVDGDLAAAVPYEEVDIPFPDFGDLADEKPAAISNDNDIPSNGEGL